MKIKLFLCGSNFEAGLFVCRKNSETVDCVTRNGHSGCCRLNLVGRKITTRGYLVKVTEREINYVVLLNETNNLTRNFRCFCCLKRYEHVYHFHHFQTRYLLNTEILGKQLTNPSKDKRKLMF
jgi:hypothetical protein